ncbi:hypothetical protein M409DRAFT_23278 [Zasmidium cellare ATCC 36951]|uniref:Rhodopsin domain-containing protein n=1 Tax=Zasmidium cellare ATCC 36951 TaxID=1080233 RepID=A0A6A6CHC7_ZASCE|nr:uncharacterized protein M409DRAFT_23278 [Zasmidium cellare ATCC 36951]KAF2166647.1 hypothetical protein M409DRAFT_23278 [Zasmidium cellare ATCC 36951]
MSANLTIPNGYSTPFAVVTDTDHGAWIIIATALGLSQILLFAGIRAFVKCVINPGLAFDDTMVFTATGFAVIQSALVLGACHAGLGRSAELISSGDQEALQKLYYAASLFFVLSLGLSKASVAIFVLRLAPFDPHRQVIKALIIAILAWTLALLLAIALKCNLSHPWTVLDEQCSGLFLRWGILEGFGCFFELAIFGIAIWLVSGLQIKQQNVITVIVMFAFRLPVILFVILRLRSFDQSGFHKDPTLREAKAICWTQVEMDYSIISATILILRPLVSNLVTHYGGQGRTGKDSDEAYQLHLLSAEAQSRRGTEGTIVTGETRSDSVPSGIDVYAAMSGAQPTAGPSRSRTVEIPSTGLP